MNRPGIRPPWVLALTFILIPVLLASSAFLLSGCGSFPAPSPSAKEEPEASDPSDRMERIDFDLTGLGGTMVYSQLVLMNEEPADYIGKTVRLTGSFFGYYDEMAERYYFSCVVLDGTACCSQGLEFVLKGAPAFPDGYPEPDELITVTGTFGTYMENGFLYCQLTDAEWSPAL